MAASEGYYGEDDLHPCGFCGRKFNLVSLDKHQNVCQKTFIKKRRVFDSKKQRLDSEIAQSNPVSLPKEGQQKREVSTKKSHWREKHEDLINTVRAARTCAVAQKSGKPLPPPPPSHVPSDYILCAFCGRHFNPRAADRHIQWCKEQKARLGQGPNITVEAKGRLEARTRYKAPLLRKKPQAASGPNLAVNSSGGPAPNAARGHHYPGKPPVRGSAQGTGDREGSPGVRVRGTSLSPTKKDLGSGSQSCTDTKSSTSKIRPPTNARVPANGSPVKSTTSYLQGKGMRAHNNSNKIDGGNYNPYAVAEKQMQELKEGNTSIPTRNRHASGSTTTLHSTITGSVHRDKHRMSQTNGCMNVATSGSNNFSVNGKQAYEFSPPRVNISNSSRVTKHISMRQATIQVREREHGPPAPTNRASCHALHNYSDSDEEELKNIEHGSRNVCTSYPFLSVDKVNQNNDSSSLRHKLRQNSHNQFGSKTSVTSKDSDYSSLSRQRTPSPPLKLPSARQGTGRRHRGHASTRAYEGDQRLSTSSSESSLPPLHNRNINYNSSNSSINSCSNSTHSGNDDAWTARFCHQCGSCYPVSNAKFCCECGARRLCMM